MRLHDISVELQKRMFSADGDDVRSALLAYLIEEGVALQKPLETQKDEIELRWAQGRKQFLIELSGVLQTPPKR